MSKPVLPGFALSAGACWLLAGALYKLFEGSPMDLPEQVHELSPLGKWETMRTAVIVELAVVGLVFAKPRVGWLFLAGTFAAFLAILFPMVQEGVESCGCFGGTIEIAPTTMMAIDGGLLLLILISRPWRMSPDSGLGWAGYLPLLALAVAGPTMLLKSPESPAVKRPDATEATKPNTGRLDGLNPDVVKTDGNTDNGTAGVLNDPTQGGDVDPPEKPVDESTDLPEFGDLKEHEWLGQPFDATEISLYADQSMGAVLPNSHVVVYRQTCEVCKEHLEMLWEEATNNPGKWAGEKQLVLIRIIENKDTDENNMCTVLPEPSQKVTLPALKRGYGLTTPYAFDVDENYTVQNVVDLRKTLGH